MKMTSFTPGPNYYDEPVIIMGGELDRFGNIKDDFVGGRYSSTVYRTNTGEVLSRDLPVRPLPGVKDVSVEYKGGGMKMGATREATINWICWDWEELERLTPHFLSPRRSVLLEWGWTGTGDLDTTKKNRTYPLTQAFEPGIDALKFDRSKIQNLNQELIKHIQLQNYLPA